VSVCVRVVTVVEDTPRKRRRRASLLGRIDVYFIMV